MPPIFQTDKDVTVLPSPKSCRPRESVRDGYARVVIERCVFAYASMIERSTNTSRLSLPSIEGELTLLDAEVRHGAGDVAGPGPVHSQLLGGCVVEEAGAFLVAWAARYVEAERARAARLHRQLDVEEVARDRGEGGVRGGDGGRTVYGHEGRAVVEVRDLGHGLEGEVAVARRDSTIGRPALCAHPES